jgi:IS5 family transposase
MPPRVSCTRWWGTAANVNDLNVAGQLLHGEEHAAFGDAGYQGVHKPSDLRSSQQRLGCRACASCSISGRRDASSADHP